MRNKRIVKHLIVFLKVQTHGDVIDLYEFKIGFGNGIVGGGRANHGQIFRHRIIIDQTYERPFELRSFTPGPGW